jgi:hypothetical protein
LDLFVLSISLALLNAVLEVSFLVKLWEIILFQEKTTFIKIANLIFAFI